MTLDHGRKTAIRILLNLNEYVRAGGSRASASRVARETLFFVYEKGNSQKYRRHRHSVAATRLPSDKDKVYDHAIPLACWLPELLSADGLEPGDVQARLERHYHIRIITDAENKRLNAIGLRAQMPLDWDGIDVEARYRKAGIELVPVTG